MKALEIKIPTSNLEKYLPLALKKIIKDADAKLSSGTDFVILQGERENYGRFLPLTWSSDPKDFDNSCVYKICKTKQ